MVHAADARRDRPTSRNSKDASSAIKIEVRVVMRPDAQLMVKKIAKKGIAELYALPANQAIRGKTVCAWHVRLSQFGHWWW